MRASEPTTTDTALADPVGDALAALRSARPALVVDDVARGAGAALVLPCQLATPEGVARLAAAGPGPIRVALTPSRARELGLVAASRANDAGEAPPRTVGPREVSPHAVERAMTALVDPATVAEDLIPSGPLAPVAARPGGVLERAGHAESALDLARLAGLVPAAAFAETERASCEGVPVVTIAELIAHRLTSERTVRRRATARLPTTHGEFVAVGYETTLDDRHHLALVMGDVGADEAVPLVRVHAERMLDDRFLGWAGRGDVSHALESIARAGSGAFVYVARADRGLGRLAASAGSTPEGQLRDYGIGAQILLDLGLRRIRLLTDHPRRIVGLEGYGLEVVGHEPLTPPATPPDGPPPA
jgi:3,4-dihydroxy 2-butanone 4-phosphate synthase/GTP cyclohydrolase II